MFFLVKAVLSLKENSFKVKTELSWRERYYLFYHSYICISEVVFSTRCNLNPAVDILQNMNLLLTESIKSTLDNSYGIFIDLQKAFDTVDHEILIETGS